MQAEDARGNPLKIYKVSKDRWRIDEAPAGDIHLRYEYFAAQPDAGACWIDDELMYVNPVHCLVFDPAKTDEPSTVHLNIPVDWQIACSMLSVEGHTLLAKDVHELLDSPFFAAKALHHRTYDVDDFVFHIWLYGDAKPEWDRIIDDFRAFSSVQLNMMDSLPTSAFHFLVLLLPYRFYHGVEHLSSTVLALGPGYRLMKPELYKELLGVASHELFHVWNVKSMRPADFINYDYSVENYSRLGWVYEGFTTYYGDYFLRRSGVFSERDFLNEINVRLQRHVDNPGRFNSSVAESSYDTWLDGYVPGVPARKVSIYDEGCLIALMLDLYIRNKSNNLHSLDDVFKELYNQYKISGKGYSENDVLMACVRFAGTEVAEIFDDVIYNRNSYEDLLQELLLTVGCTIEYKASPQLHERNFGFRVVNENGLTRVSQVMPGSPAEIAGLAKDDEIAGCNGWKIENNLSERVGQTEDSCRLTVFSMKKEKQILLGMHKRRWFDTCSIIKAEKVSAEQKEAYLRWMGVPW